MTMTAKLVDRDVNLNIRVEKDLRDAFSRACQLADSSASRELRHFMRQYVAKHAQQQLKF
ncbi:hypothetical protein [Photorhabdus heterorhabditis]|uniref:Plasmid-related protein n=1 Tax=Photorhabdus heterorhabditis TaxID=880156 RepID=A0A5B0VIY8_9GAMM|nr:hypothetical protein [Photorhabdus heterorhabditis]KAA1174612.1 hypothetical protein F0L16_20840 [Photorhabdus heterorhabditis]KOY60312.1 hypothetical protein AM629_20015 [Photorhabdus heterorhabditis]